LNDKDVQQLHAKENFTFTGWAKKVSLIFFVITLSTASQFA